MKNITKNYTLFTFEELSEKAKDKVRYSQVIQEIVVEMQNEQKKDKFNEIFEKYGYGDNDGCELGRWGNGHGQIFGKITSTDISENIFENHPGEELQKEMELLLNENHCIDIRIETSGKVIVEGDVDCHYIAEYTAETDEEQELLFERLLKAASKLEDIIMEDFKKMSSDALKAEYAIERNYFDEGLDDIIDLHYENEGCFLADGNLFV